MSVYSSLSDRLLFCLLSFSVIFNSIKSGYHYGFCSDLICQLCFISLVTRFFHSEIPLAVCKHVSQTSVSLTSAVEVESDVKYGVKYSLYLMLVLATAQQRASQAWIFWEVKSCSWCWMLPFTEYLHKKHMWNW